MPEQETPTPPIPEVPYEPPTITCLGQFHEVVLGSGSNDTADLNTSRYW